MATFTTATRIRIAALVLAGCGVVCSIGFWVLTFPLSAKWGLLPGFFIADALPYALVVVAIAFSRTRGAAAVCLVASLLVLAFGVYTCVDWTRFSVFDGWINDIELLTYPFKWLFGLLAGVAAVVDLMVRMSRYERRTG